MRTLLRGTVAVVLLAMPLVVWAAAPAAACSCMAPDGPPALAFEGIVVDKSDGDWAPRYTFDVKRVIRGRATPQVAVTIDAIEPPQPPDENGAVRGRSSCAINKPAPEVGRAYSVETDGEDGMYSISSCGGSFTGIGAISAPPPEPIVPDRWGAPLRLGGVIGGVGLVAVALLAMMRSFRRPPPAA